MATIGQILDKCAQAGISVEKVNDLEIVLVNTDGDDVQFSLYGYDEGDDQFIVRVLDLEVSGSAPPAPTESITVTVPEGVEVIVTRQVLDAD